MNRTDHWKLGLFVSLGLALAVGMLFWLGLARFRRDAIPAVTYFDESVQGLEVGSPVKFRGVVLGTVASIIVAPDSRHVQVDMQIFTKELQRMGIAVETAMDPEVRVQLVSAGITGVKFLQLDFFDPARYPAMELPFSPEYTYIASVPSTLKGLEQALNEFVDKMPGYGESIKNLLDDAREAVVQLKLVAASIQDENGPVRSLVRRVDGAVITLEKAVTDAQLGPTTAALRSTAGALSTASNSVGKTTGEFNGLGDQLEASLTGLREALEAVRALMTNLNHDPSSLVRGKRADTPPEKHR